MGAPLFFNDVIPLAGVITEIQEDTAKHITQVLRMKEGDSVRLTNGGGVDASAIIISTGKKTASVKIISRQEEDVPPLKKVIAISLLKNTSRFEWFLEKATELGITHIIPLICARTEKQYYRSDRFKNILTSAMLQSQQVWLPELSEPFVFSTFIEKEELNEYAIRCIAHCYDGEKRLYRDILKENKNSSIILIGPEGDFTPEEVVIALSKGFTPVSLGRTRLRTETAGIAAAVLMTS